MSDNIDRRQPKDATPTKTVSISWSGLLIIVVAAVLVGVMIYFGTGNDLEDAMDAAGAIAAIFFLTEFVATWIDAGFDYALGARRPIIRIFDGGIQWQDREAMTLKDHAISRTISEASGFALSIILINLGRVGDYRVNWDAILNLFLHTPAQPTSADFQVFYFGDHLGPFAMFAHLLGIIGIIIAAWSWTIGPGGAELAYRWGRARGKAPSQIRGMLLDATAAESVLKRYATKLRILRLQDFHSMLPVAALAQQVPIVNADTPRERVLEALGKGQIVIVTEADRVIGVITAGSAAAAEAACENCGTHCATTARSMISEVPTIRIVPGHTPASEYAIRAIENPIKPTYTITEGARVGLITPEWIDHQLIVMETRQAQPPTGHAQPPGASEGPQPAPA